MRFDLEKDGLRQVCLLKTSYAWTNTNLSDAQLRSEPTTSPGHASDGDEDDDEVSWSNIQENHSCSISFSENR